MNRVHTMAFRLLVASLIFWSCFAARTQAQTPPPTQESSKAPETKPANQEGGGNPFAPEPAAPLPASLLRAVLLDLALVLPLNFCTYSYY